MDGSRGRLRDQRSEADRRADALRAEDKGLSAAEAADRLARYGPNVIVGARRHLLLEIGAHFWGPIPWMIEAALLLTALTTNWTDFGIILVLLLVNGGVGSWEEHQAHGAIEALQARLAKRAQVQRAGEWTTVEAADLVPGDLISVERGDVIAADAQILKGRGDADESALTGESLPVEKAPGDEIYSGAVLLRGGPIARVLATGAHTVFGRTAELARREPPPSHFQQAVLAIGRYLIIVALALVAVIVAVSLARGSSLPTTLEFALVVVIASVPVALPAVLSVTMAVGARKLAHREAVVSHLPVVEELAGVDVLCVDKTGTLTRNELAVAEVAVLEGRFSRTEILRQAALTAEPGSGDPIDRAILRCLNPMELEDWDVIDLEPFDPVRKRAEAHVRSGTGCEQRVAKGAVQAILDLVGPASGGQDRLTTVTRQFALQGYRALAVAQADAAGADWHLTGILGLQDPPREDSAETLTAARRLGLDVKMITGDRVEIARHIAGLAGLADDILEAAVLHDRDDDAPLAADVEAAAGFAEVVPEDKYRIVQFLQARGHIVGMTGDGVNDVPALERADAGIAVAGGTDAARAAADIVLVAPGLSTIVEAIRLAREVFQRMKNYAIYRITETIRVVLFVTLAILFFDLFPVTPVQIVLLAILNDGAILAIAYDRVRGSSRPVRWDLTEVLSIATCLGVVGVASSFGMLWLAHDPLALSEAQVQTLLYLKLSVAGHLTVFVARTHGPFWSQRPSWILASAVIGTQGVATAIALTGFSMEPIGGRLVALAWAYALAWFLVLDQAKVGVYRLLDRRAIAAA